MKIQFIGATGTVTGSKYILTLQKKNYMIDCGLFQGLQDLRLRNWRPLPVNPKAIEFVILTHAHIDHCGYLPLLVKNGFRGPVYATPATQSLCEVMLPDAGHLQEEDALFANRHKFSKHHPALPLYTEADARECLKYIRPIPFGEKMVISRQAFFKFIPAGHILGAAMVQFTGDGHEITFSGDIGRPQALIMKAPVKINKTDFLVMESTYGDRCHPIENPEDVLKKIIVRTVERGGIVLIPAFAVGRAQQVLFLLSQLKKKNQIPDVPIYLNSPMAVEATRLIKKFPAEQTLTAEEIEELCSVAQFVSTANESKALNSRDESSIIISASGMATGGRVLHHLKKLLPDPKNSVVFVGFQAAGTRGEAIMHEVDHIKIHGLGIPVEAETHNIDTLSAHADADEIMSWLKNFGSAPKKTFLTHGEPVAAAALKKRIEEELHWECVTPDYLDSYELS